ncbi:MAG: hypothetical protein WCO58_01180 [bacterium]
MKKIYSILICLVALSSQSCKKEISQSYKDSLPKIISIEKPEGHFTYRYKMKGQDTNSKDPKTGTVYRSYGIALVFSNNVYKVGRIISDEPLDRSDSTSVIDFVTEVDK